MFKVNLSDPKNDISDALDLMTAPNFLKADANAAQKYNKSFQFNVPVLGKFDIQPNFFKVVKDNLRTGEQLLKHVITHKKIFSEISPQQALFDFLTTSIGGSNKDSLKFLLLKELFKFEPVVATDEQASAIVNMTIEILKSKQKACIPFCGELSDMKP